MTLNTTIFLTMTIHELTATEGKERREEGKGGEGEERREGGREIYFFTMRLSQQERERERGEEGGKMLSRNKQMGWMDGCCCCCWWQ
jgi:hypothetical protein